MGEANGSPLVWLRMLRTVIGCFGLLSNMWSLPRLPMSHLTVELRQIFLDRVVQLHLALVDQHHQRGGRDGLGLRGDPEEAVGLHRLLRGDVGVADRLGVEHLVLVGHQHDRAGQLVLVHEGLHAAARRPPGAAGLSCPRETTGAKIPAASTTGKATRRREALVLMGQVLGSGWEEAGGKNDFSIIPSPSDFATSPKNRRDKMPATVAARHFAWISSCVPG